MSGISSRSAHVGTLMFCHQTEPKGGRKARERSCSADSARQCEGKAVLQTERGQSCFGAACVVCGLECNTRVGQLAHVGFGVVVAGGADTLRHDALWQQWLEWCEDHQVIVDKNMWQDLVWVAIRNAVRSPPVSMTHTPLCFVFSSATASICTESLPCTRRLLSPRATHARMWAAAR